jgi:hypothetical protein
MKKDLTGVDSGRRRFTISALATTAIALAGQACKPAPAPAAGTTGKVLPTRIGVNIGSIDYWSGNYIYADIARQGSVLKRLDDAGKWSPLDPAMLDRNGWPLPARPGTAYQWPLLANVKKVPPGPYRCHISDGFDVHVLGRAPIFGSPPEFLLRPAADADRIVLQIAQRKEGAKLDKLSCLIATPPYIAKAGDVQVALNPAFLDELKPFKVVRFMDLMKTNSTPQRLWAERTLPEAFTQTGKSGMAIEHMVAIANAADADPWFTLPYDVDEGYYRNFATLVRKLLNPARQIYIELSNEVWNGVFAQTRQAEQEGLARNLATEGFVAGRFRYAQRAVEMFADWSTVFADDPRRIVRVLGVQAVVPRSAEQILSFGTTAKHADALAIAPYFGLPKFDSTPGTGRLTEEIFARGHEIVDKAIAAAVAQKEVANRYGVRLIAYEGGQHLWSRGGPAVGAEFLAANHDPRMRELYAYYLSEWQQKVGDLIVLYESVGGATPRGTFGMRDYSGQPIDEAPKMQAVMDFLRHNA